MRARALRNVSLEVLEEHNPELVAKVEAGERISLVRDGRTVATIEPKLTIEPKAQVPERRFITYENATEAEREQARQDLLAMMNKGYDFKGYRCNRDELYDDDL